MRAVARRRDSEHLSIIDDDATVIDSTDARRNGAVRFAASVFSMERSMNVALDTPVIIAIAVVAVCLIAAAAGWTLYRKRRSTQLRESFGPEYRRTVDQLGSREKAEAELAARERRVAKFHIVPLTPADAARFGEAWKALQSRFVDDPRGAVAEADRLIRDVMAKRGYPMGEFERSAADLSVSHPAVVSNYRAAHAIAARDAQGGADTEALRRAIVHYRALFNDLLETRDEAPARVDSHRFRTQS
jgi:hypothetical protein